jgi:carboxymethylenebutenolidase
MSDSDSGGLVEIPSPGIPLFYGDVGAPLVVILHDWYGRLPWIEPYAQALADRGALRVVVPDLYGGVATVERDQAEKLSDALDAEAALGIVADVIGSERANGSQRVGLIGFSLGAWLALQGAQRGMVDAAVIYYGTGPDGIIPAPLLFHLAETDEFEPTDDTDAYLARLKSDGTPVTSHTYAGTEHNFANATVPGLVDTRSAALAFARTTVFLEAQLHD